ncbi:MAG: alpha/beta fold hydrolase [Alphaproteobacteria bacterium]|jgi:alpha-beta hydrolase superfamily lysophospholipase|nr:hypothetical protein [Rhodospirillaceae bacterium]MDP6406502.1 alpha/beta fold hydrolase [Alphaproteobacteria bacterium]MDP6622560.1 alpha/beta fold hydrolase [Alphaproteobacteria bacterium]|tara:strand:+ start:1698 stop:2636 length:939 start_codon:yes stop_codon:yes gene_type:complete
METSDFIHKADDGAEIFVYRWWPEGAPRAVVQIAHGMAEHAARYAPVAAALTAAGYGVVANDHRGHGRSAQGDEDLGFFADRDGWNLCLGDLYALNRRLADEQPELPRILLGHSMGSFMAQQYFIEHGDSIAAGVLSGSNWGRGAMLWVGLALVAVETLRLGPRGRSTTVTAGSFGAYNDAINDPRTPFDWLSRDADEVQKYVDDPRCGFICTNRMWHDMLHGLRFIEDRGNMGHVPKHLPIYVFAGSEDPISDRTQGLEALLSAYRDIGLSAVSHKFYRGGRHEMFNETNREEVFADLIAWLDKAIKEGAS